MTTDQQNPETSASQTAVSETAQQAPQQAGRVPKELRPWQAYFAAAFIPLALCMFTCAMLGLWVLAGQLLWKAGMLLAALQGWPACMPMLVPILADQEEKSWLGQSWFGREWRMLTNRNQFLTSGMLNGGLLG